MPMRIPQPIQIWFNSLHNYRKTILSQNDFTLLPDKSDENFIDNNNPLLIGGIENLLLEMIPKNSKPIIKDGAIEVAQWICENLIMLYDVNDEDCYHQHDSTNRLEMHRKNLLIDLQLVTIELLPTILYVYFCLFVFLGSTKYPQSKLKSSSSSNKSEIKLIKLLNFDKFHPLLKQDEDIHQMIHTESDNLMNITKKRTSTIKLQTINQSSPNEQSPKVEHKVKFSNVHKLIKQRTKKENDNISPHQKMKKHTLEFQTNEQIDLMNIFEVYLLTMYQICRKKLLQLSNEEKLRVNFETIALTSSSVYCNALFSKNEINKVEYLPNYLNVIKSNDQSDVQKQSHEQYSFKKINECTFNSGNRMHILTALMKEYSAYSSSCVSKQSRISLCKLACLFNPFTNHDLENMPVQFEESDLMDDDEHSCDKSSMKLEVISENERQNNAISEGFTSQSISSKTLDRMEENSPKGMHNSDTKSRTNKRLKFHRVTGLSPNFVMEILFSLYPVLFTEHSDLACEGVRSLKARAEYEIWSNVLLLISSIEKDYTRSKSSDLKSLKFDNRMINQHVLNNNNINQCSVEEHKLDSEQLSLASAYCGLWSGLLGKRSDVQQDEILPELGDIQDLSGKRLQYVRLAQAKFKRPVVTNSNFKTVKLPDDITPISPHDVTLSKQNENKDCPSTTGNAYLENKWKGSLDDLSRLDEPVAPSFSFTREWFRKTLWKEKQAEKS
ncbi:unnamed protein product [Schistosoma turkestanicum]|nr:unnamed protein product [Schistosoma turkestanicum]